MDEPGIRRLYELWNQRENERDLNAFLDHLADDAAFFHRPQWPGQRQFEGKEGFAELARDLDEVLPGLQMVPSDIEGVTPGDWVIRVHQGLADEQGQLRAEETVFHLMRTNSSDHVREFRSFSTREEAVAAAEGA